MFKLKAFALIIFLFLGCAASYQYLKKMNREEKITYFGLKAVATREEIKEYLELLLKEREEWLKIFWKKKDPTPLTEENEFLNEHNRRLEYILSSFSSSFGIKPWDDRGDIYLTYGEPDERELRIYKHWHRSRISPDLKERYIMEESFDGWGMSSKQFMQTEPFADEDKKRAEEIFYSMYGELWTYSKYFLTFQFEDEHLTGYFSLVPYTDIFGRTQDLQIFQTQKTKTEAQKEVYIHDYAGEALDFALDLVRFRERKQNYQVFLNIGLPLDEMGLGGEDTNEVSYSRRIVFFDEKMNEVEKDSAILTKIISKDKKDGYLLIDQKSCLLKPGKYTLAIEIKDLNNKKIGIYKKDFWLPKFEFEKGPVISDVELASYIRLAQKDEKKYTKQDLLIMPLPTRLFSPKQNVNFYYEIYELKQDKDGKAKYSVSYSLINFKNKKEKIILIPELFEADTTVVYQVGRIDPAKVPPGDYALAIKIRDLISHSDRIALTSFRIEKK